MQRTLFIVCVLEILSSATAGSAAPADGGSALDPRPSPAGLSAGDWDSIVAARRKGRHTVRALAEGFLAHNPGQRWDAVFDGRGVRLQPDGHGWEWGLELRSHGFAGAERTVTVPRSTSAEGQRVDYGWDETLEEWFVNDTRGLEHGFTVHERPARGTDAAGSLCLSLAVLGELRAEVDADGRGARFRSAAGADVLVYAGLTAFDSDGTPLDARLESQGGRELRILVDERGARYPLTIDPIVQQAYVKASNTDPEDHFGRSVAVFGNTVVVGAPDEASAATGVNGDQSNNECLGAGAAYVFVRDGAGWSQQAYLKASNTEFTPFFGDLFGTSVAISGDTVVIGAPAEDGGATGVNGSQTNGSTNSGAAYVFVRQGTTWSQQAYVKASNTGPLDQFGHSVALSGDLLVVGAPRESSSATGVNGHQGRGATDAGAAYVFTRSGTTWTQEAYLKASNTLPNDNFGISVAASGERVVVGAWHAGSGGSAYVFARNGTQWSQEALLRASNADPIDAFGWSVAISGDTIVVGAHREGSSATGVNGNQNNNEALNSGAAYVFRHDGTTWTQEAYLKASNTDEGDRFGESVAVSGNLVAVGAYLENSSGGSGAAYVFQHDGTQWSHQAHLKPSNTGPGDQFGWSLAMSLGTLVVGAPEEDSAATGVDGDQSSNSATDSGAGYLFQLCPEAIVTFRNAGSNPASYVASPAVLGASFTATVDNNLAAQTTSLLFAFDTATAFPLNGGQVLLCYDQGSGEIFTGLNLAPTSSAGGVDSYSLAVPNDPTLTGFTFFSQALQFGSPPFALSNAQDLVVGSF